MMVPDHVIIPPILQYIGWEEKRCRKRMEKFENKNIGEKKAKKAYITWDDNDLESSDDSKKEVINQCLMGKNYESNEEVTSSNKYISFDELQDDLTLYLTLKSLSLNLK